MRFNRLNSVSHRDCNVVALRRSLLVAALIATCTGCTSNEEPSKSESRYKTTPQSTAKTDQQSSPESVFKAYVGACELNDWKKAVGYLTPKSVDAVAGMMKVNCVMVAQASRKQAVVDEFKKLFAEHGIPNVTPRGPDRNPFSTGYFTRYFEPVKDKASLCKGMAAFIVKHSDSIQDPRMKMATRGMLNLLTFKSLETPTEFKTSGDVATAVPRAKPMSAKPRLLYFKRKNGKWFIDIHRQFVDTEGDLKKDLPNR